MAVSDGDVHSRVFIYANAMLDAIKLELADVSSFTRDDLLYLRPFLHVATITRYRYICMAVRWCLDRNHLLEVQRGVLIMAGTKRRYKQNLVTWDEYEGTIRGLIAKHDGVNGGRPYNVYDLLLLWDTDQFLSSSTKRTIIRETLKQLASKQVIKTHGMSEYSKP